MSKVSRLFELIDKGRKGDNVGLSMGMPKLEELIDGVTPETYYLVAGSTGSAKTSFVLYSFIYKPLLANIDNNNYYSIIYSLEMTEEQLLAKLLSFYVFEQYGIEIPFKLMFSRGKDSILDDDLYKIICKCKSFLEKIESRLIIFDGGINADSMKISLEKTLITRFGKVENGRYILNNPNIVITVVLDHIGLIRNINGRSKKEEIDLASSYLVYFRNIFKISPVVVSQVNRNSSNIERRKASQQELQLDDLKNSGNPSEDANVVLALFYPFREKMSSYRNYDIKILQDRFRGIVLLKNRFGAADASIGTTFYGASGVFKELPRASSINDYSIYKDPNWISSIKVDNNNKIDNNLSDKNNSMQITI